jgi:uncharacterized protein (DUF305 family)
MRRVLTVIAIAALLAGCGGGSDSDEQSAEATPNIVQPGAPGEESRKVSPEEAASDPLKPTDADVDFMQGMIHHHDQAILMTGWVPERTASPSIKLMAERMAVSQQSEIEQMERWLKTQGHKPVAASEHGGHNLMPGMLTQAQLDRLEAADGRTFDRLFLRYMTQHHHGAITMVHDLREDGGGLESEIDALARHIETDQEIEIQRMQDLLAKRKS